MKIKPCPFCGEKAKRPNKLTENKWHIDHPWVCWIGRGRTQVFEPKEIKFWNCRKP